VSSASISPAGRGEPIVCAPARFSDETRQSTSLADVRRRRTAPRAQRRAGRALLQRRQVARAADQDASGDSIDAVLCALQAAWGWTRRRRNFGIPEDAEPLEGWIVGAGGISRGQNLSHNLAMVPAQSGSDSRRLAPVLAALLCLIAAAPAWAQLRFGFEPASRFGGPEHEMVLSMRGEIGEGDADRLKAFVSREAGAYLRHGSRAVFAIDGGDVLEAMEIGRFLREALIEVWLPDTGSTRCVSACFLMFAAAAARDARPGTVGIHRPYFSAQAIARASPGVVRERYDEIYRAVRAYLDELFVPKSLSERMLSIESSDTYWLDGEDLEQLGRRQAWFADFIFAHCGDVDGECVQQLMRRHRQALLDRLPDGGRVTQSQAGEPVPDAR
jgi:hypothetical protein